MYQTKFDSINAELPVRKSRPRHLSTISANYSLFCLLFSIKDSRLFTHTVGYVQLFDVTSGHIMRYSDRLVWLVNDYYTTNEFAGLALEDEVEYMDTSETPWYWYYKARCGVWHRVEDDPKNFMSSNDLERYYLRNPKGVINMTSAGVQFQINFAESTQFNVKTGKIKQIKRSFQTDIGFRCKCDDISPSPPAHWENVDPKKPYQLISLRKDCREYQEMERFVRDVGLLHDSIVSITRIQNMDLWELFCRKKIQLMRIKGQSDIEEQMLFHGTSAKNVHSICTFNFSCRLSDKRRKGHVLGKGTYFAKHASFATKYSENTCQGTKVMLLARVIVGKYRRGHQDYCTPNDDQNDNIHDSCVDNALCPRIFVIFDSNQIYPEYVLEYRCS